MTTRASVRVKANDKENNIPLTAAKATTRSADVDFLSQIQQIAISLVLDAGNCLDGIHEVLALGAIFDMGVDQ
jgi:hypothetical protein